jgi:hypothetical protein
VRRLLVAVAAATLALSGCGAVRVSVERLPESPTTGGLTPPPTSPAPRETEPTTVGPRPRVALEQVVADHPEAELTIALAPVGGQGAPVTIGSTAVTPAWSTVKVPLALATADVEAALVRSDNEAAMRLWTGLGTPEQARAAVEAVLREAGDRRTAVEARQAVPGYSPFGQTRWRPEDQARFMAGAACLPDARSVTEPMGRVVDWQDWGLGRLDGAVAKGGWGPTPDGYVVRQVGLVPGAKGGSLAVAVQVRTSSHEAGTALADEVGRVVERHLEDLPGGRCEKASQAR